MKFKIKKTLVWMLCTAMTLSPIANAAASETEYLQAAEASTEVSTELSTEKLTEAAAEKILAITESEAQTEPETKETETKAEAETQFVTEAETQTEVLKEETPLETETELQTELVAEETETAADTEAVTEEIQTEAATETQTEIETKIETELQTEAVTEETEISTETELQTEAVAEETEITTEKETEIQKETPEEITGEIFPVDHIVVTALETNYEVKLGTPETDFSKIYVGRKEDVEKTPEYIGVERTYGGYEFRFEVSGDVLGQEIYIVPYVAEAAEWYVEEDVKIAVPSEVVVPETLVMEETAAVEEVAELNEGEEVPETEKDSETEEESETEDKTADGDYLVEVGSDSKMFKVVNCVLTKKEGKYTAEITLSGTGYDKLYMGTSAEAAESDASTYIGYTVKDEKYNFMIPVSKLDTPITIAAHSVKNDNWIDRVLTFKSETLEKKVEDGDYSVQVDSDSKMFKVIDCVLTKKDGKYTAGITLSGTGYDKLYLGTSTEAAEADASTYIGYTVKDEKYHFVIPVTKLDKPITIAAHSVKNNNWIDRELTFKSETLEKKVDDGDYSVEVESDSKMFKVVKCILTKKDGKYTAEIALSGTGYDKLYMGTSVEASASDEDAGIGYEIKEEKYHFVIPVEKLDTPIKIAAHSVKNNNWIDRTLTFKSETLQEIETETEDETESETQTESESESEPEYEESIGTPDDSTVAVDNSTKLADGVYSPESFNFSGGSGKTKITCLKVTVKAGKAYATIQFSSSSYDYVKAAGFKFDKINTSGNSTFEIPVKLNAENIVIGNTTAMSTAKEIEYKITPVLAETAVTEKETEPETETQTEVEKETEKETENGSQVDPDKLQNGDYRVQVDSSAAMFRVIDCVLTYKNGVMTAKITLSGTGYDKLFMGTSANAANASDAQKIGYTVNADGKYVFEVPVSALDTPIAVAAHSHKNATWYDREITFRSEGMTLLTKGEDTKVPESETQKETEKKEDNKDKNKDKNKADKESSYESDLSGGTGRVDSSTGLKDGVYTPDKFSWSGGSGRTSISCSKVTVSGGQAYATIVFGSSNYGYVKANGNKYFPSYGAGTSSFTIPVKLNANNTIIGMTTAMSAAHEITYTIYVYIAGADKKAETTAAETVVDQNKLSEKAPEIIGLEYENEAEIKYAENFKMYYYNQGITLIEIDMAMDTAEEAAAEEEKEEEAEETEDGEVKDANALIAELYQNKIVKYLFVPEDAEIPVGLEKEMIVVYLPVDSVYTDSVEAKEMLKEMELEDCITVENEEAAVKPEYKDLILAECDLAILSGEFLQDEEHAELLFEVTERLTTLGIPAIIDRSAFEESEEAKAEWQMIYEKLFK